jgi:hypothetical protein
MRRRIFLPVGIILFASGCAHRRYLVPESEGRTVWWKNYDAVAEVSGVFLVASGNEWFGRPKNLGKVVTPFKVSIWNRSGELLRIQYSDFRLMGAGGVFNSAPLSPFNSYGRMPAPLVFPRGPEVSYGGFEIAPYYAPFYPGLTVWRGPFESDGRSLSNHARWPASLPTPYMRDVAIPEGVIQKDGHISGFLYFPKIPPGINLVTLHTALIAAGTRKRLGTVAMPFVIAR